MSTTPKLYTLAEARKLVAEEDASSAPSWSLDSPRFIATVEALDAAQAALNNIDFWLDERGTGYAQRPRAHEEPQRVADAVKNLFEDHLASRAAFEQLQRDATSAAEKYLDAINDSEARAQAAQARVVELEARVGVLAAGLRDVEQANANCQTRIVALEREAKLLSDDDDACHRLLDQALGEGTSNDTSMETLLERLPRLVARAEKAEAEMAELREALANLEAACASVASWSEECLDYSDATRVAARKLLAKLEG